MPAALAYREGGGSCARRPEWASEEGLDAINGALEQVRVQGALAVYRPDKRAGRERKSDVSVGLWCHGIMGGRRLPAIWLLRKGVRRRIACLFRLLLLLLLELLGHCSAHTSRGVLLLRISGALPSRVPWVKALPSSRVLLPALVLAV